MIDTEFRSGGGRGAGRLSPALRALARSVLLVAVAGCSSPRVTDLGGSAATPTPPPGGSPTPAASPTPSGTLSCPADPSAAFPAMWINGADCSTESPMQVFRYDANTWIVRQSMCTNFEGPFLYLLFGQNKALLEDTGAGNVDVAGTIQPIVQTWLSENGRTSIPLVVVNSHAHGDHVAGNSALAALPNTTLVGTSVSQVQQFFGIANWPTDTATFDLGGRVVDVVPIPGHQAAHIALYDHGTGWLMTGDTLYPGRLYVSDFPSYVASIQRLVDFTADKTVCNVMGTHIEMTSTPKQDFAYQSTYHPSEHKLPLTRAHLLELNDAVKAMQNAPVQEAHDDFIVVPQ